MTWKYFDRAEFGCPCGCGENKISDELIDKLENAREYARRPFRINSGYRCANHNAEIGGSPTSSHLKGLAADIHCVNGQDRYFIMQALFRADFRRIEDAPTWIHVDIDLDKPNPTLFHPGD